MFTSFLTLPEVLPPTVEGSCAVVEVVARKPGFSLVNVTYHSTSGSDNQNQDKQLKLTASTTVAAYRWCFFVLIYSGHLRWLGNMEEIEECGITRCIWVREIWWIWEGLPCRVEGRDGIIWERRGGRVRGWSAWTGANVNCDTLARPCLGSCRIAKIHSAKQVQSA